MLSLSLPGPYAGGVAIQGLENVRRAKNRELIKVGYIRRHKVPPACQNVRDFFLCSSKAWDIDSAWSSMS